MMQVTIRLGLLVCLCGLTLPCQAAPAPLADAHLHYNWNQAESLSPEEAIAHLREQNTVLAVVASTPSEQVLQLKALDPDRIVALFSPYLQPVNRHDWAARGDVVPRAREALASGQYEGIGEVHLIPGIGPRRDNDVLVGLITLAAEYDVPLLIHTEASDYRYLLPICRKHTATRFVWAHAGGMVPASQVGQLLLACPNVWVDLSARDPLRYVRNPITDATGALSPDWRQVVLDHPDRFMVGSDAVWPVTQLHSWFEADSGWARMGEFNAFHRRWLSALPTDVARKIRLENAHRVYRGERSVAP